MVASLIERTCLDLQQWGLGRVRALGGLLHGQSSLAPHLATGIKGEEEALFELGRTGYVIVARRWTSDRMRGDIDLIGWEDGWLCFIEVKTRTARDFAAAESAVDRDKQRMVRRLARAYLKVFRERERGAVPVRFDVVSVYLLEGRVEVEIFRDAFKWH